MTGAGAGSSGIHTHSRFCRLLAACSCLTMANIRAGLATLTGHELEFVPSHELHVFHRLPCSMSGKQVAPAPAGGGLDPVALLVKAAILLYILWTAYDIRLHAVRVYGRVIHEFDPWFNFRATDYLVNHGAEAFWKWYDLESWYPLGRPVGTTIYAGLQFTSAYIFYALQAIGMPMSLNDVCVFVPAWFGVVATTFLALLASECAGFASAGVGAALVMSIIPAHIMRSVAGGYDNESVAVSALCATFYFW